MLNFYEACRENTGAHFLDSGGAYGRHHENPPIDPKSNPIIWNKYGVIISTAHFLDDWFDIDVDITRKWEKWDEEEENSRLDYFTSGDKFMKELGYTCHARDNIYNYDNDMSQVWVWEVWTDSDEESDWIYPEGDCVTVIYIHTGCDVRGGYGRPIFCRSKDEYDYPVPIDVCAEFSIIEIRRNTNNLEPYDLDEKWQCGYSAWPMGELEDDIDRIFEFTRTQDTVCALLKSGEVVKIQASYR